MRKLKMILLLGLLLIGSVFAGVITNSIIVNKGNEETLRELNIGDDIELPVEVCVEVYNEIEDYFELECHIEIEITNLQVTDSQIGDKFKRCLYQKRGINTCKYFNENNPALMDEWMKERLDGIAEVKRMRDARTEIELDSREVEIKEK